jgi:hypothetical protein
MEKRMGGWDDYPNKQGLRTRVSGAESAFGG